ncbi:MAG: hypothetical protein NTY19_32320 [Planctomycetota bacterium]|nr:hypothetical protein [Planctomycetota bacterium]
MAQSEKKAKGEAQKSAEREKDAKDEAVDAATRETQAKEAAEGAAQRAQDAEKVAVDARLAAEAASYVAQVGLAAGQIASNSFLDAERVLREYQQPGKTSLRDWEWGHLTYLCNLAYRTLKASQRVECVAWSPDGRYLVAGSIDGWVRVWAFPACEELVRIDHHTPVHAVAITPDGQFLATGGDGPQGPDEPAEIKLWKLSGDGRQATFERALAGHGRAVLALHFSPDQAWLLSSSRDETARLWSWRSAQQEVAFRGHFGPVWSAAFAPAGDRLVTAGEDATVRVWTRADGTELKRFRGHKGAVYAAAFSPDGRRVASAGRDNRILVWEPDRIQDFDFAALERQLANQGSETVSAPDTEPDRPLPVQVLAGHNAEIRTLEFASHFRGQEGDFLLSGGHDHTVRVWNLQAAAATTDRGRTFRGHGGWVRAAVFSPDGRYILSGGYDSQLKLWDPTQYEEVRVLRGQDSPIGSVAFSRRADRAITAGRDGVAVIWHLEQAQPLKRLEETLDDDVGRRDEKVSPGESAARLKEGHDFLVNTGVFFPEGDHRLLTSAGDNTVRMWDLTTGGQLRCFRPTGQTNALALSDDGKWILTGSDGSAAQLWPTDDAEAAPLPLADHRHEITAVAISPGGELPSRRLLTGDANGECRLWRWDSQQNRWSTYAQLIGHAPGHSITAMRFLPGNRELLTACQDRTVMRWEVATGRPLPALMLKHPDGVRLMEVSADGRQAVTVCLGSAGYRLSHWDLEHAREEQTRVIAEGTVTSVAFDQAGRGVLVCVSATTGTSSVQRWDPTDGQYGPLWPEPGSRGTIWAAVPSPDGSQVLTVGGRRARLWEARTGQLRQIFGHHGPLTSASFSPSGALAVTAGTDGAVKLWNVSEQDPGFGRVKLKIPQAHDGLAVNTAMFVADASGADAWLLTGGDDGVARLWDLSGHERQSFVPPGTPRDALAPVCCAVCSPDGQRLATAHQDGTLRIWDVAGKLATLVGEPRAHDLAVLSVCFSQDGRRLVTGSGDNTVKLWNLETNRAICTLKGHTASVTSVAFFPDGRRVVSGSQDGMAKIWDTASGNQVLNLGRHAAEVTAVAVSSDGRRVLTASNDQTAILWFSDDFTEPAAEKKP